MKKILLVEDDKFLVRVLRVRLQNAGYEIKILESGSEVQQTVENWSPDLILLDIAIPDKDGFEILRDLKKKQGQKKVPVLAITQLQMDQDISIMYELGASFYINKSEASYNEVVNVVNNMFLNT